MKAAAWKVLSVRVCMQGSGTPQEPRSRRTATPGSWGCALWAGGGHALGHSRCNRTWLGCGRTGRNEGVVWGGVGRSLMRSKEDVMDRPGGGGQGGKDP